MNAIIPLHIAALRVSATDANRIAANFKGRTAAFDHLPYQSGQKGGSTGDSIVQLFENEDTSLSAFAPGIHLHWELPDYFKKGTQVATNREVVFPAVPNRWLVTRYLSKTNKDGSWSEYGTKRWVVESDYISMEPADDGRKHVPVPWYTEQDTDQQPFRWMGRVVDLNMWPSHTDSDAWLGNFKDPEGKAYYLNAVGFVGPLFSGYYPDCQQIFGFHDDFYDEPDVYGAIQKSDPVRFKASYHVAGWIEGTDPLDALPAQSASEFVDYAKERFGWSFEPGSGIPSKTICNGIMQEVVWDMLDNPGTSSFLGHPGRPTESVVWESNDMRLSMGNTQTEALSVLLSLKQTQHREYEYLMNMIQTERVEEIDRDSGAIDRIEHGMHADGFSGEEGGILWSVRPLKKQENPSDPDKYASLPVHIARQLSTLNVAQKAYGTGREALAVMRRQLFIDWYKFVKSEYNANKSKLSGLVQEQLEILKTERDKVGLLSYTGDEKEGVIRGVKVLNDKESASLAKTVAQQHANLMQILNNETGLEIIAVPDAQYQIPSDPVMAIESDYLDISSRNGNHTYLPVRTTQELIDTVIVERAGKSTQVKVKTVELNKEASLYFVQSGYDMEALCREAMLLMPVTAEAIGKYGKAVGGFSPLEAPEIREEGLFERNRSAKLYLQTNVRQEFGTSQPIILTLTNGQALGRLPCEVGWNKQAYVPELHGNRCDAFIPVSMVWKVEHEYLNVNKNENVHSPNTLTESFSFDAESVDLIARWGKAFTSPGKHSVHSGSSLLVKKAMQSVTAQIEKYSESDESAYNKIQQLSERRIASFSLAGFGAGELYRRHLPPMPVLNLPLLDRDNTTKFVSNLIAADALQNDRWDDQRYNTETVAGSFDLARNRFRPLRAGFLGVRSVELIDVFGQRMRLLTKERNPDGTLQVIPASTVAPPPSDEERHLHKAYLPPRILTPSRVCFRWLSAEAKTEYVEMTPQPFANPVCGWILPNHLDFSLHFYNSDGTCIGSLGIEHGKLTYRTRAANTGNPTDSLEADIGTRENPTVNVHLAQFMWYLLDKSGEGAENGVFLDLLIQAIQESDRFVKPESGSRDASLALCIGKPLALVRGCICVETFGETLPLDQADTRTDVPAYRERMEQGCARLQQIDLPLRLGAAYNMNDGLVGYLIESDGGNTPYGRSDIYAPTASPDWKGVVLPADQTLTVTLNSTPKVLTMLVDPRAAVHVSSGILPREALSIPPEQYTAAMSRLHVTFPVHPVLQQKDALHVPLPSFEGYGWSWINIAEDKERPVSDDIAHRWGYSPQTLEEGWLKLTKL